MKVLYSLYLYFVAFLYFIVAGPILLIIGILLPKYIYKFGRWFSIGIFKCFRIKYEIIGEFPNNGPYIMMHNHSSFLDLFFLPLVIKGKYTGVVAKKNFNIPLLGLLLNRFKAIPIQRSGAIKKSINSLKIAESRIQTGYHVAIFPEGTRTLNGKLSEFKKGGFHMALNTQTKILPITVKGLYDIKPRNRFTIIPGKATMIIKSPIEIKNKTVDDIMEETYNAISENIND